MIPPPLGIGSIVLDDGSTVRGFICEPAGLVGAREITEFGGWVRWRTAAQ
jgi:allophanate hydrolase